MGADMVDVIESAAGLLAEANGLEGVMCERVPVASCLCGAGAEVDGIPCSGWELKSR